MNDITPVIILTPLLLIVGGLWLGLMKAGHSFKLRQLAYRERIAALERGVDPALFPSLPGGGDPAALDGERTAPGTFWYTFGIMALFVGVGAAVFTRLMAPHDSVWMIGIVPVFSGLGALTCGWFLDRRGRQR